MSESSSQSGTSRVNSTATNADSEDAVCNLLEPFRNLLGPGMGHLNDMTKRYSPAFPYPKDRPATPAELKKLVLSSERIRTMVDKVW